MPFSFARWLRRTLGQPTNPIRTRFPARRLSAEQLEDRVVPSTLSLVSARDLSLPGSGVTGNGSSEQPEISANGRYVVFQSGASNLVPGDTNSSFDIFRKDLVTGEVVRVSTTSTGAQANGYSYGPSISSDGRYVAFYSAATNLAGGTNGYYHIYRKDVTTGAIVLLDTSSNGQANNYSYEPSISADGQHVAFYSSATNLGGGTNGYYHVYRKDVTTGVIALVDTGSNGQANGNSSQPSISSDGRYVAFVSYATNLGGGTNGYTHIYRKDMTTGAIALLDTSSNGQANGYSYLPSISADGQYVAFESGATNLAGGTNGYYHVYRKDVTTGAIVPLDTSSSGQANSHSELPSISADGRYVAFMSSATNLGGGTNGYNHIYRKDVTTGAIIFLDTSSNGQANNYAYLPSISSGGQYVAFMSSASNLVSDDNNGTYDVFVWSGTAPPTDIALSNSTIAENAGVNAVVGTLSATDPDVGDTFTYALVPGTGDADNALFTISGNQLLANDSFNFEGASSFSIRVRATDAAGLSFEKVFTISVTNVNEPPYVLFMDTVPVPENSIAGTLAGYLSSIDTDLGDFHTLDLINDAGGRFVIIGYRLELAAGAVIDYETTPTLTVRVRATDLGGLYIERDFTITVTDRPEVTGFDVQKGANQRSYIRYLDLAFDNTATAAAIDTSRLQLVKADLNGNNPTTVGLGALSIVNNALTIDFGALGLGGNRNSNVADGYYTLKIDFDGDGTFDTTRSFYRLLGDINGDRTVNDTDVAAIDAAIAGGIFAPDLDVNGDGSVNSTDRLLAFRARGRALNASLPLDD